MDRSRSSRCSSAVSGISRRRGSRRPRRVASSGSRTASGPSAPAASAGCSTPSASPATAGSRRSRWNTARHLELYFAAPCTGRVLHTLNIRLFPDQLTYIVNHAEDEVIFVDRSLAALLCPLLPTFTTVRHVVVMDDGKGDVPDGRRPRDPRLRGAARRRRRRSSSTSTTSGWRRRCATRAAPPGNPKGVVYSHRSTFLHTIGRDAGRLARRARGRRDPAGRADVPRQRLGARPRRRGVRRRRS